MGGSRKWRRAEEGRDVRFWVIYSGGNGLNQGLAAPLLTYFDLSPCFGIFIKPCFLSPSVSAFCCVSFLSLPLVCSVNEALKEKCGLQPKIDNSLSRGTKCSFFVIS